MSDRDGRGTVRIVISFVHTLYLNPLRREAITFGARFADHGVQLGARHGRHLHQSGDLR